MSKPWFVRRSRYGAKRSLLRVPDVLKRLKKRPREISLMSKASKWTDLCFLTLVSGTLGLAWRPLHYAGQPWWLIFFFPALILILPRLRRAHGWSLLAVLLLPLLIANVFNPWEPPPRYDAPHPFDKAGLQRVSHWTSFTR